MPEREAQILVVDDDQALLRMVEIGLVARGYDVLTASTGASALELAEVTQPDLVILDLGLPDMDGLDVGHHLRQRSNASIVVLSADGSEDRKIRALDDGADDYLTKPFSMRELQARLRVSLRHRIERSAETDDEIVHAGALLIDVNAHEARVGERPLDLTPKEFALLSLLARNYGKVLTHRTILTMVWGPASGVDKLRAHISQLRKKLRAEPSAPQLLTEPGVGYRLVEPEATDKPQARSDF